MSEQDSGGSFTKFPKLSKKLKLKIWEFAADPRRTIVITSSYITGQENGNTIEYHITHNAPPLPNVLGACRESLEEVVRKYARTFGSQLPGGPIYFNFDRDILFFKDCHALKSWFRNSNPVLRDFTDEEKKLKVIAISGTESDFETSELLNGLWWLEKLILQESEENQGTENRDLLQNTWRTAKRAYRDEGAVCEVVFKTESEMRELASGL
jgi:hypothetical protein